MAGWQCWQPFVFKDYEIMKFVLQINYVVIESFFVNAESNNEVKFNMTHSLAMVDSVGTGKIFFFG